MGMEKLSPQKQTIVSILRDLDWHCGREWLHEIKYDRVRISELNGGYMKERGWVIVGEPCRGTICKVKDCPLYKRRAEKLEVAEAPAASEPQKKPKGYYRDPISNELVPAY
jgi:hypothetical protein